MPPEEEVIELHSTTYAVFFEKKKKPKLNSHEASRFYCGFTENMGKT